MSTIQTTSGRLLGHLLAVALLLALAGCDSPGGDAVDVPTGAPDAASDAAGDETAGEDADPDVPGQDTGDDDAIGPDAAEPDADADAPDVVEVDDTGDAADLPDLPDPDADDTGDAADLPDLPDPDADDAGDADLPDLPDPDADDAAPDGDTEGDTVDVAPCSDECEAASAQCADEGATQTCGQHDGDACLEWSAPVACPAGTACSEGSCVAVEPETVLVNEVLYDAVGGDGNAGTTVFVELWGPPGLALDDYEVVGVNGNGGGDYETIPLDGHAIGADGLFVIAHPDAAPGLQDVADMLDAGADLQNGPDSVQVRWGDTVLDALAYGTFGSGDVFAGEGQPAPATPEGQSLSRASDHGDTDDNASDFSVGAPSPGAAAVACADECTPDGAQECVAGVVRACGDHDADSCLEWGDETACGVGLECDAAGAACDLPWLYNYEWSVQAGAAKSDWARAVAVNDAGEALVTGIFTGPFTLGTEEMTYDNTDVFLAKIDAAGQVVWARDIGGFAVDQAYDLALAPNGDAVFTGLYDGTTTIGETTLSNDNSSWDAYVARYTTDGEPVWAMKFAGDGNNEGLGVATSATGDIYVAGVYEQWASVSTTYAVMGNAFLAKLDAAGEAQWSFGVGGPEIDLARGVAVDASGDVLVTGSVGSLVDFDPGEGEAMGGPGLFVAKYDASGQYLWHYVKSGAHGLAVAVDSDGDAYVAGTRTAGIVGGTTDGYLLKLSASGAYQWSSQLGSIGHDALRDVAVDPVGNVLVTGDFGATTTWEGAGLANASGPGAYEEDAVLAEFTPDGAMNWVVRFGGPDEEWGHAVAAAPTGHAVWAGHLSGTVTLNDDTLAAQGFGDLTVIRFAGTSDGSPGCFGAAPVCSERGACQEVGDTPQCTCDAGWGGEDCSQCAPGFEMQGSECVDVCTGYACGANQHCEAQAGSAACVCDTGYAGDACDTCAAGYVASDGCIPDCGPVAPVGACADCAGALELWPGVGSLEGFLVDDGKDAKGECGGWGPDHALTVELTEPMLVDLTLVTKSAVLHLRRTCDDPETQVACDAPSSGGAASVTEVLSPGSYTLWLDTDDPTGSTYTLSYSFTPAP